MRHRLDQRKLGRTTAHRKAMLRNLVTGLFLNGRIVTTVPRAKEARRVAERLITWAKKGSLHHRRRAISLLQDRKLVRKLFSDVAERFRERVGGYTRIVRMGGCRWDGKGRGAFAATRLGDNAERAVFELVERKERQEERYLAGRGKRARLERETEERAKKAAPPEKK